MLKVNLERSNLSHQLNIGSWNFEGGEEGFNNSSTDQHSYNESELVQYLNYPQINKYQEH
jgi:hypothetical protein